MLSKLAFQNAKRSFRDYIIYLITVTLSFSLMFSFNLIVTAKDVIELGEVMKNFEYAMYVVNVFVLMAICFLINYTTKFMFEKRSKEFGTYLLLGIKKKQITKMYTLENIFLGLFSFIMAIPLGYLLSLFFSFIIMKFFELPQLIMVSINVKSVLLLFCYFTIIYVIVLLLSQRRLKKIKIYELLYFEKQNEKRRDQKRKRTIIFLISLLLGISAIVLFDSQFQTIGNEPSMFIILISLLLLIISIYGTSITISDFLLNFVLTRKKLKYKKDNLFVVRTFYSKAKTMSITLGTISFLITLTLISLNVSSLFKGMFDYQLSAIAPYDISVETTKDKVENYLEIIEKEYTIDKKILYHGFLSGKKNISSVLDIYTDRKEQVITLSDYNKLLKLKGDMPVTLSENEYILHITKEFKEDLEKNKLKKITLENGKVLNQKELLTTGYCYSWGLGYGYLIIVPDSAVENLKIGDYYLIANTKEKTTAQFAKKLKNRKDNQVCKKQQEGYTICYDIDHIVVRGEEEENNKGFMTITAFVCFYIAIIFTAITATILAIEQLSDANKYKYRYQVLNKLGVSNDKLHQIILKQLSIFFLFPVFYPIIVSLSSITSMNRIFKISLTTDFVYLNYFFINLLIFLICYCIYFTATYFGFKNNIHD